MLRGRGRRHAGGIGGRRCQRPAGRLNDGTCIFVRGHPDGDGIESRRDLVRNEIRLFHDNGEGAGPECFGKVFQDRRDERHKVFDFVKGRHMNDQRVVAGTPLGFEDAPYRFSVQRIGRESIDGLGRDGDEFAVPEKFSGRLNILFGIGKSPCVHASSPAASSFAAVSAVMRASMSSSRFPSMMASIL